MALPSWPITVPHKPIQGSWSMPEPFLPPEETEMDGGNTRRRRRPGDDVATIGFTLRMTREQWALLYEWLKTDCFGGTSRFIMTVWLGSEYVSRTVQFDTGFQPSASEEQQFLNVPIKLRVHPY